MFSHLTLAQTHEKRYLATESAARSGRDPPAARWRSQRKEQIMRSVGVIRAGAVLGSVLLTACCSSPRTIIFDGVALVRNNGQVLITHRADRIDPHQGELKLTGTEMELLRRSFTAAGLGSGEEKPYCLTGVGNPPPCYPMNDCKDCIVVVTTVDSTGKTITVEFTVGQTIPYDEYTYYCMCTHQ
jgi:hypothetical protein